MTDEAHILAIDLGTSGPKVALVSPTGDVVGGQFEPIDLLLRPDNGAEQDPAQWWSAIAKATRRVVAGQPELEVAAIAVTSQWSGTVPVDGDGNPIGNAIIWMDGRGAPHVADLVGGRIRVQGYDVRKARKWIQITGGAPTRGGKDPIAHVIYLREERPDIFGQTRVFLEPKDYINLRLTGRPVATYDSIALHWVTDNRDPANIDYHPELLEYTGIDRSLLPDLVPSTEFIGGLTDAAAADLDLRAGTPVLAGTPDVHSAAIGSGTTTDFMGSIYVGTSSWITCHVPFKKTDLPHNIASLPAGIPGRYLVLNEQETAGKAVEWLGDILYPQQPADVHDRLNEIAAGVPAGSRGVIFTPWLYGERTPVEDATLRAGFFNQSLDTGRAEMVRAVFEGVAYNSRWLLGNVEKLAGTRLDPIVMAGGGALSAVWGQIMADVMNRTIHMAEDPVMVNVRGVGLLGHVALGNLTLEDVPPLVPIAAVHRPNPVNSATYHGLYDAFRRLHKNNRRLYRKLNRTR